MELKYWDGRGLAEVPRMLLAIGGKFPGDYVDGRYYRDGQTPSEKAKPYSEASGLDANLGRMPTLSVGDAGIGQSAAINYYCAAENGLMGKSNLEAAQIIAISEHLKELMGADLGYRKVVPPTNPPTDPTKEQLDTWFDTGAEDKTGTAEMGNRSERRFKWWCGRLEGCLGDGGFAVGGAVSLADVLLYNTFAECLTDAECQPTTPASRKEPFTSKARTDAALANFPKIKACCASVAGHPNIQKWLASRGKQNF